MLIVVAAGALALAPLVLGHTAQRGGEDRSVVVRDRSGEELVRAALPPDRSFALAYRHSYYRAPARELFSVRGRRFRLAAIESPRAAVLDYYALEGRRTRSGSWRRLMPAGGRAYERLALIATKVGRRTLVVGKRRFPLWSRAARHLTISVEGSR